VHNKNSAIEVQIELLLLTTAIYMLLERLISESSIPRVMFGGSPGNASEPCKNTSIARVASGMHRGDEQAVGGFELLGCIEADEGRMDLQ